MEENIVESGNEDLWNKELETLPADALFDLHEKALLKQLKYLSDSSPFYQEKFKKAGVAVPDIKTLEDIARLPFTEKKELH
ncbi:MAG: hypothetical protein MUO52_17705, partial [Desulfobacterales bacterium]|nr:hypothetical protein [Desulfobacterales bacterium]